MRFLLQIAKVFGDPALQKHHGCATARELHTISLYFEMKQGAKIDEKNEIFIFIGSNSLVWNNSCKFIFSIFLIILKETNEN